MKLFSFSHAGLIMSQNGVGKDVNVSHARRCMAENLKNPNVVEKDKVERFTWFLKVEDTLAKSTTNERWCPKAYVIKLHYRRCQ